MKTCTKLTVTSGSTTTEIGKTIATECIDGAIKADACDGAVDGCTTTKCPDRCEKCADGYWPDTATLLCTNCKSGCLTCTSASVCSACKSGYATVKDTAGVITSCTACTSGQYLDSSTNLCTTCTSSTTASSCICDAGKYWSGTACVRCD